MYEKKCIQFLHDWSHFSSLKPLLPIYQSKPDRQQLLVPFLVKERNGSFVVGEPWDVYCKRISFLNARCLT